MSGPVDMNDFMSGYEASVYKITRIDGCQVPTFFSRRLSCSSSCLLMSSTSLSIFKISSCQCTHLRRSENQLDPSTRPDVVT